MSLSLDGLIQQAMNRDFLTTSESAQLAAEIHRLRQIVVDEYARGFKDGVKVGEDKHE